MLWCSSRLVGDKHAQFRTELGDARATPKDRDNSLAGRVALRAAVTKSTTGVVNLPHTWDDDATLPTRGSRARHSQWLEERRTEDRVCLLFSCRSVLKTQKGWVHCRLRRPQVDGALVPFLCAVRSNTQYYVRSKPSGTSRPGPRPLSPGYRVPGSSPPSTSGRGLGFGAVTKY